ncbi:rhoa GTPase effector DIA/Diaphanous [Moesziomyces antarcticus T-34]|uniref:Rhoa GTPase effector DIA/Diaphanous n=1 Tax=Pseudozyma antarctica (strain T-34) TaxID=1151754 RepID=M9LYI8_PSEA3|nr:rhoa GTPase effector DIA/Diaphanous [Moesziomyces antarcticus T-34]
MYHLITGLYAEWTKKPRYNALMVGAAGVGKSCLLEKIKSVYLKRPALPPNRVAPTVGQNVLELSLPRIHLHFWDLGGSPSVRTLWSKYYDESDAVVWVVDARHFLPLHRHSDKVPTSQAPDAGTDSFAAREASWKLLSELLMHPSLEACPVLIVANCVDECESSEGLARTIKQWFSDKLASDDTDVAAAAGDNVFADDEAYRAPSTSVLGEREYEWDVVLASAFDGMGVHDVVDWLAGRVQRSAPRSQ